MIEQLAEDRELARERADKRGRPPSIDAPHAGIFTGVAVFMLLDVFAAITLPDRETAFWPIVVLTALLGGGVYLVVRTQQRAWSQRYNEALDEIEASRQRRV
jgi:hypothetical protein